MNKKIESIALRYLTILVFGLGNLFLIYSLFTPLTYYSVSFILSLFGNVINFYDLRIIIFNQISIELVNACIAGSAYFLLIILNFSIPNIQNARRIKLLLFCMIGLFVLNIIRIVLMTFIAGQDYFASVHMFFWYIISILFVVGIWFYAVYLFKIKEVPIYSDIKYLVKQIK